MQRFRQLLLFLRPYKRPLILAVVLTGVLTLIGMAPPLLMRPLLNDVARDGRWGLFPLLMALLFVVPFFQAVVNIANSITLHRVMQGILRETRRRIFQRLMRLSVRFYHDMPVGGIQQRLMPDVFNIASVATGGMITLVVDLISVVFAVVVMLRLSPTLSLLPLALLPLFYLNYRVFTKRIRAANAQLRSRMDHISSMLQERLSAHELIQAYGQEDESATHFESQAKQVMDSAVRGSAYSITFNQLAEFITKVGNTLIYCAGCYYFVKGSMGYGDVVAFCAYATQLLGPVVRFASVANQVAQVGVSVDRVNEILQQEPAIREEPNAVPVDDLRGEIHTHGLTFGYDPNHPALREIDLTIPAGTHLAVVGPAGSGRSTLAMLLRRFYDPVDGSIEVDGTDIRHFRLRDYREALALVLPESTVFDGTIRMNLLYGKPEATEQRMVEVTEALGLHEWVTELADGYDTRLGTGGLRLAAGVQQQIGIARALLSEPLVLITDEATASLDPITADRVNGAIAVAMQDRTLVLIVSRAHAARHAHLVAVMDDGRLIETGTHDELIRTPGSTYRAIFEKQYGSHLLPPVDED